jgi:serine/threonine-protein kinase RsbW
MKGVFFTSFQLARGEAFRRLGGGFLKFQMPCQLSAVRPLATQVRNALVMRGVPEKIVWACELALVESCNNAVQHACDGSNARSIEVEVQCSASVVELRINDQNPGFSWPERAQLPEADEESGRGLYLIRTLMDKAEYLRSGSGNCLVLQKRVGI